MCVGNSVTDKVDSVPVRVSGILARRFMWVVLVVVVLFGKDALDIFVFGGYIHQVFYFRGGECVFEKVNDVMNQKYENY